MSVLAEKLEIVLVVLEDLHVINLGQRVTGPAQHEHHVRGPISQGRVVFAISRPCGAAASRGCPAPGRSEPALGDDEPVVTGAAHDDGASR